MHCSFAIAALLVSAVAAKPINKRALVVETEYAVVVETVFVTQGAAPATVAPAAPTTTPAAEVEQPWTHSHVAWSRTAHRKSTTTPAPAPVKTTTVVPEPTTTPAAPVEPTTTTVVQQSQTQVSGSAPTTYEEVILYHHNLHRANHSASALTWSPELAAAAQDWASQCNYEHNTAVGNIPNGYGQNIAAGAPADQISNVITDMMYNGEMPNYAPYYGLDNPSFANFASFGHFTQIVWKGTTEVGCATVTCNSLQNVGGDVSPIMTVCNYGPAGNMGGEYGVNVGAPLGGPTIYGTYGLTGDYS